MTLTEETYYSRQLLLADFGPQTQDKLRKAKVLVVGAGGLGCPVLQYLACAGVGNLGIVDGDSVDVSNLHRQVLFGIGDLGVKKAVAAAERLTLSNPFIQIKPHAVFLSFDNAKEIINDYDLVVDCTDNYQARFLINDFCVQLDKPIVSGSIYRFEGQVSVFNYQNGPTYRCLFPDFPTTESSTNCSEAGVIGILPGMIGLCQANEVIKIITGIGEILSGSVLVMNAMTNTFFSFSLQRDEEIYNNTVNNSLKADDYSGKCELNSEGETFKDIEPEEIEDLFEKSDLVLIDVRELNELPRLYGNNLINLPLSVLEENVKNLPLDKDFLIACKSGMRSKKAINILRSEHGLKNLYNLKNGINHEVIEIWKRLTEK